MTLRARSCHSLHMRSDSSIHYSLLRCNCFNVSAHSDLVCCSRCRAWLWTYAVMRFDLQRLGEKHPFMPYIPHTPETLIGRSDSKDASTTCKGITAEGRPCRRSTAGSSRSRARSIAVALGSEDDVYLDGTAFFCWQHKDQVQSLQLQQIHLQQHREDAIVQRTSIDTLVDRLGLLNTNDKTPSIHNKRAPKRYHTKTERTVVPLASEDRQATSPAPVRSSRERQLEPKIKHGSPLFLCCFSSDHDVDERIRPRRYSMHEELKTATPYPQARPLNTWSNSQSRPSRENDTIKPSSLRRISVPKQARNTRDRPVLHGDPPSQTERLLSIIPKSLSPHTASLLLAELAKPFSDADEEGYIYMFCLTDHSPSSNRASKLASTIIDSPPSSRQQKGTLDQAGRILQELAIEDNSNNTRNDMDREHRSGMSEQHGKSILLKIGRASNVHRRMNEWTRQCGYDLSLVRFYPHPTTNPPIPSPSLPPKPVPSSPSTTKSRKETTKRSPLQPIPPSSSTPPPYLSTGTVATGLPHKVQHVRRVERLIHLELAASNVRTTCQACGTVHREWFAVEPTREGVRAVHETVQRWVNWAEIV